MVLSPHYEANGCSTPDCTKILGVDDPRLDVKVRLTVYVDDDGVMRHNARFFHLKHPSKKLVEKLKQ